VESEDHTYTGWGEGEGENDSKRQVEIDRQQIEQKNFILRSRGIETHKERIIKRNYIYTYTYIYIK
jgi:hypothetical protein